MNNQNPKTANTVWGVAAVGSISLLLLAWAAGGTTGNSVTFLDVGQGDAILLQDGTRQVLIDGGAGMAALSRLGQELPQFDRTIEVVISTHPDRDHLEGLLHVLERYPVKLVLLPAVSHSSQLYEEWLKALQQNVEAGETAYRFAEVGQRIDMGDMEIQVLSPSQEVLKSVRAGKTNNASVITRVDMGGMSWLLTGDAEAGVEQQLTRTTTPHILDVDVLKAGHHGSKTSTSQALLSATSPQAVVISVGADNPYGHPHPSVMQRLTHIPTWRTDEAGSVRFVQEKGQWLLKMRK